MMIWDTYSEQDLIDYLRPQELSAGAAAGDAGGESPAEPIERIQAHAIQLLLAGILRESGITGGKWLESFRETERPRTTHA
jgi:hypothetical protein